MLIQSVVWGTCLVTPLLVAWGLQRQWLFPRPKNGEVLVAEHHQIDALMLPLGHRSLKGFMARPRAASGRFQGVLYLNGRRENPTSIFRALHHMPNSHVLCFFYDRLGPAWFKPDEVQLVSDALAVLGWFAREHGAEPDQIHVVGRSLGSGLAVQVAAARPVAGLVLISPFDCLLSAVRVLLPYWPAWALKDAFDSVSYMPRLKCPGLMVMGDADKTVPLSLSRRLQAQLPEPWPELVLAGAGHRGLLKRAEVHQALGHFLAAHARAMA